MNDFDRTQDTISKIFGKLMPPDVPVSFTGMVGVIRALRPGLSLTDGEIYNMAVDYGRRASYQLRFVKAQCLQ